MRTDEEIQDVIDRVDNIGAEDMHHAETVQEALNWVLGADIAGYPYEESNNCEECEGYSDCQECTPSPDGCKACNFTTVCPVCKGTGKK